MKRRALGQHMALAEGRAAAGLNRISFAFLFIILGATGAHAQMEPAPGQRMFDIVSGIVFSCGSATGFAWTGEACDKLSAEFRKRAEATKLPFVEVPITADVKTKKMQTAGGFDRDKAVRMFWNFTDQSDAKGVIGAALSATRIWEPTAKEIPNAAPGQRIPVEFLGAVRAVPSRRQIQGRRGVSGDHHELVLQDRRITQIGRQVGTNVFNGPE